MLLKDAAAIGQQYAQCLWYYKKAITRKADAVFDQGCDFAAVVYKDKAAVMFSFSEWWNSQRKN